MIARDKPHFFWRGAGSDRVCAGWRGGRCGGTTRREGRAGGGLVRSCVLRTRCEGKDRHAQPLLRYAKRGGGV
jgi:hypothetical protein